jgi:uncharacterized LabA/DUF88 family protein
MGDENPAGGVVDELAKRKKVTQMVLQLRVQEPLKEHEFLRTYFYHAPPADQELRHPMTKLPVNLKKSGIYAKHRALIEALEMAPEVAVRLGETRVRGWKLGHNATKSLARTPRAVQPDDFVPNISQKGVDLRMGLDIARMALREMVRIIVVVTGDSDLVPAFKFARREGVRVFLDTMGHGTTRELKVHTDWVMG